MKRITTVLVGILLCLMVSIDVNALTWVKEREYTDPQGCNVLVRTTTYFLNDPFNLKVALYSKKVEVFINCDGVITSYVIDVEAVKEDNVVIGFHNITTNWEEGNAYVESNQQEWITEVNGFTNNGTLLCSDTECNCCD